MKIRAKANGNIVDVSDGDAAALLAIGIYESVDAPQATKVKPLTTKDLPKKKAKKAT